MAIPSLARAEKLFEGRPAFAARLGVSASAVGMWHNRGNIPTAYLKSIENAADGRVTVYELLADIEAVRQQPADPEGPGAQEEA